MADNADHAGDISPEQAMDVLKTEPGAVLIDVRTGPEWENVGVPDLASVKGEPVFLEWLSYPAMSPNAAFAATLEAELKRRGAEADTPLLFLCRSGARSAAAARAMTSLGFGRSHNVAGGFEGSPGQGLPGWKAIGLPWTRPAR